jgi:hypothetical protein
MHDWANKDSWRLLCSGRLRRVEMTEERRSQNLLCVHIMHFVTVRNNSSRNVIICGWIVRISPVYVYFMQFI